MKKVLPYIAIILSMVFWAGAGIAVKQALQVLSPMMLVVMRFSVAVVVMLLFGLLCRRIAPQLGLQRIERQDAWLFVLAGVLQPFLYFIFETYTYQSLSSPTIADAILSTSPLVAPFFAWWLLKEKISVNNIIGIIVSTIGMFLVILAGSESFHIGNKWGFLLAFISVLCATGYVIALKRFPSHYNALTIVFWVQLISLCLFIPTWLMIDCATLPTIDWHTAAAHQMLYSVLYLGIFACVVAFILFAYAMRELGVTRGNAFNNIRPAFTAILMWLLLDEHLPVWKIIGMAIIILGLFISQKKAEKFA